MADLSLEGIDLLARIGSDLDRQIYPDVYRGGRVEPGASNPSSSSGNGKKNDPRENEATRVGRGFQGAQARQGSGRPAASRTASPVLGELNGDTSAAKELEGVVKAYPQMKARATPSGFWLTGIVTPIRGLSSSATLCVFVPTSRDQPVKAWAWWDSGVLIGPRHTNFGDASICSFEPRDGTWTRAHGLVELLDLHVTWIVRHLHLHLLGRWPGNQTHHTAYERLHECQDEELCGCPSPERLSYKDCCKQKDLLIPRWTVLAEYFSRDRSRRLVLPRE
jgi:hypothetical protein